MRISPAVIGLEPGDHVEQRGLAAARRADQHQELALLDLESRCPSGSRRRRSFLSRLLDFEECHDLPFHRAGHQAAHEVAAGDDVDEQRRQRGDDRAGEMHVVFLHAGRGVDQVVQRHRHRHASRQSENEAPNRKSFQMLVNCQITVTTMIGPEIGSRMRRKIWKKPAPSICAARTSSVGNAS